MLLLDTRLPSNMARLIKMMTPGLFLALFFNISLAANDGREFCQMRPAGNPDGKLLSAKDVVYGRESYPARTRNHYGRKYDSKLPCLISKEGSLYAVGAMGDTVLVARGEDGLVYGETVSRNEFGIDGGIFPANSTAKAAFYRKDESRVRKFPLLDIHRVALNAIRYPMNGEASEKINVGVYDFATGRTIYLATDGVFGDDQYLTNVCWSPDDSVILIQILDRAQQNVRLDKYSAEDGAYLGTVLTEHSDTWVEPREPLHFINAPKNTSKAVYTTDSRDGWWNLYLVDTDKNTVERLTKVSKDVEYVANDGQYVYFMAPDEHPVNNYLWKVSLKNGRITRLTEQPGWHSIDMAPDCKTFVDVYEALDHSPESLLRCTKDGKILKCLMPSDDPTKEWAYTEIDMGTVTSENGRDINYYRLVKPLNFDPSKKYPLILYVYGGPHSQLVRNTFLGGLRRWEMYMAQKGYAVFVMDGRGTERHGAAYEHSIWRQCGVNEMKDQMQAMAMLKELPWVDSSRIGVYGWSYGGFMSLSLATGNPDTFKACVAGGPVIDWKWYEVMYGERYMSRHQDNPDGFAKTSLLPKAASLKVRTLVIEGGVDPVVVPQNALAFLQECIDNGVRVEYFTYPHSEHNMTGKDRVHLVDKITAFFQEHL